MSEILNLRVKSKQNNCFFKKTKLKKIYKTNNTVFIRVEKTNNNVQTT